MSATLRAQASLCTTAASRSSMWRELSVVAVALLVLTTGARADDSNFRPYPVGARAAGMGGAFTALSDDGSGPFYNPGGVAFTARSQLSLSGSVYGVVSGTIKDVLSFGDTRHDFKYSNLNVFPTSTSAVWKPGAPEATSANVFALSVFVPDAFNGDDRDTIGSQQNAFFLSNQEQTVWIGSTYARRMGSIGIGVTGFFLLGTRLSQLDLTVATADGFAVQSARVDQSTKGVVGALGVRWDATGWLRLGASVYSPAIGWGSRRAFARQLAALNGQQAALIVNEDHLHASPTEPLRAQAGVALKLGSLTLSGDVIQLAAREVVDDAGTQFERRVVRKAVTNFAAGMEYTVADRFPLRVGFFTDFAASRSPDPQRIVENSTHIDRFGGTGSVGYRSEHTSTDLGLSISGGSGKTLIASDVVDYTNMRVTDTSELLVYVFLATSFQF